MKKLNLLALTVFAIIAGTSNKSYAADCVQQITRFDGYAATGFILEPYFQNGYAMSVVLETKNNYYLDYSNGSQKMLYACDKKSKSFTVLSSGQAVNCGAIEIYQHQKDDPAIWSVCRKI